MASERDRLMKILGDPRSYCEGMVTATLDEDCDVELRRKGDWEYESGLLLVTLKEARELHAALGGLLAKVDRLLKENPDAG